MLPVPLPLPYPLESLPPTWPQLQGEVAWSSDGDTVNVIFDDDAAVQRAGLPPPRASAGASGAHAIRFAFIDAPETAKGASQPGMAYGAEAKASLQHYLPKRSRVTVAVTDVDRYGRVVGVVFAHAPDGGRIDVNLAQLSQGAAWIYAQYMGKAHVPHAMRTAYEAAADVAKRGRLGLWGVPGDGPSGEPVFPGAWRAANKASGAGGED